MDYQLTDERLAWLAVRDRLGGRADRGRGFGAVLSAIGVGDRRTRKERISARMSLYAVAVDEVARQLNPEERRTLRQTGAVPPWFVDRVEERYQLIRRDGAGGFR